MGTVLISKFCHYCEGKAETEDHIIPRCDLPKPISLLPYWFRQHVVVPCCKKCNNDKSWFRSSCTCPHCEWVWNTAYGEGFIPRDYIPHGYWQAPHHVGWVVGE